MDFWTELEDIAARLEKLRKLPIFGNANVFLTNFEDLNLCDAVNAIDYALYHRKSIDGMNNEPTALSTEQCNH